MELNSTNTLPEHIAANINPDVLPIAVAQHFLYVNKVSFGVEKPQVSFELHSPSWMIAETPFFITEKQADFVESDMPEGLDAFSMTAMHLMVKALFDDDPQYTEVRSALFRNLQERERNYLASLYMSAIRNGHQLMPMSMRPDVQVTKTEAGQVFKIIEVNGDGRADKGNTQAVAMYSELQFGEKPLGRGLANAFTESLTHNGHLTVATVLPDAYRTEYDAQNRFFADAAHLAADGKLNWITVNIRDLIYQEDGIYYRGEDDLVRIDLIDREFELPGFKQDHDFEPEKQILSAHLEGKVGIIGSLLPFSDKYLFSLLFNNGFEQELTAVLGSRARLEEIRDMFAETMYVDATVNPQAGMRKYKYFESLNYEDVLHKLHPLVLKRTGNIEQATESKGVIISADCDTRTWAAYVTRAFDEGGWVLQRFYPSVEQELAARESFRSVRQVNPMAKFRFAPYFVRDIADGLLKLGNILVTGKIDHRQKKLRNSNLVHAQRGTAYQTGVVRNNGRMA